MNQEHELTYNDNQLMLLSAALEPMMIWCGMAFFLVICGLKVASIPTGNLQPSSVLVFVGIYLISRAIKFLHKRSLRSRGIPYKLELSTFTIDEVPK